MDSLSQKAKIFVVATPIGNLEDLTLRAKHVLREVDLVIAEDTRITRKLLAHLMLHKPTIRYDDNISDERIEKIIQPILRGRTVALVTDAGTPNVSDPGWRLVRAVLENAEDAEIIPIPGPSALTSLISIAHFPLTSFVFLSYPPHKKGRDTFFASVGGETRPVILYETPHRIVPTLARLAEHVPAREIIVGKELTKLYERVWRGSAAEVSEVFEQISDKELRGEFVIAIAAERKIKNVG
jgi:16S rRNA (cytidine1402-2'-O)-methyltransferase